MEISDLSQRPIYLERNVALPDMGSSGLGPRTMTATDARAIMACTDLAALARMRGYARSYFATAGGIVLGAAGTVVGCLVRRRAVALVSVLAASAATLVTIEARRRARQWESVIDAAIARAVAIA